MMSAALCKQTGSAFAQISPQYVLNVRESLGYVGDEMGKDASGNPAMSPCSGGTFIRFLFL